MCQNIPATPELRYEHPGLITKMSRDLQFGDHRGSAMKTAFDGVGNIGRAGKRRRWIFGAICVALAAVLVQSLTIWSPNRWWRITAFPLLWLGAIGLLEASRQTCVVLAARHTCEADVDAAVLTPAALDVLAGRGRTILRHATLIAVALTLLSLAWP